MDKNAFDADMENYLSKRSGQGLFRGLFSKKTTAVEPSSHLPPVMEPYGVGGDTVKEEKQDLPRKGFFSRIFGSDTHALPEDDVSLKALESISDMKEVARITLNVIKLLPDEKLESFKRNPDFQRLKEILRHNNLIK